MLKVRVRMSQICLRMKLDLTKHWGLKMFNFSFHQARAPRHRPDRQVSSRKGMLKLAAVSASEIGSFSHHHPCFDLRLFWRVALIDSIECRWVHTLTFSSCGYSFWPRRVRFKLGFLNCLGLIEINSRESRLFDAGSEFVRSIAYRWMDQI